MAADLSYSPLTPPHEGKEAKENDPQSYEQLISSLPTEQSFTPNRRLLNYHGCWYPDTFVRGGMAAQDNFKPWDTDILITSLLKSGTTWLKALTFATVTRKDYPFDSHPILSQNIHDCVPLIEEIFGWGAHKFQIDNIPPPRLLSAHMPYSLLPEPVKSSSKCRIIYVCRDPKDTLVSTWHFYKAMTPKAMEQLPFATAYERFCKGISPCGPIWDHILGYWRESRRRPEKVLFFKYEEMMEDPMAIVKRLAEFVGQPFSVEEEEAGLVEEIVRLCSFEKLSSYQGNSTGDRGTEGTVIGNSTFFRKGKVGDWKNYLNVEMARVLDGITEDKFHGSGFKFSNVGLD